MGDRGADRPIFVAITSCVPRPATSLIVWSVVQRSPPYSFIIKEADAQEETRGIDAQVVFQPL